MRTRLLQLSLLALLAACLLPLRALAAATVTPYDLNFTQAGESEFLAGFVELDGQPVDWTADAPWTVTVHGQDYYFNGGTGQKPITDLSYRLTGGSGPWQQVERDITHVVKTDSATPNGRFYVNWRIALHFTTDPPGSYSTTLVFTITQP